MFGLVFRRAFGSLPPTTFFPVFFESWKGPAALEYHCGTAISFHILLPYNLSNREVQRNLDLSCCPPAMTIYTFITEFSYMCLIDYSTVCHLPLI